MKDVAARFLPPGQRSEVREYGAGNINKTYLVTPHGGAGDPFLVQRLNTHVFREPERVMRNMRAVSRHMLVQAALAPAGRRWEVPHVLLTHEGEDFWRDADGSFWRALRFIGASRTIDAVPDAAHAREVGHALGTFHARLADMDADALEDTLPGFHVTPGYLARYDAAARPNAQALSAEEAWCARFVEANRARATVLEAAREQGLLRLRPIHGDPKVNNILFDAGSGHAIAMVDWDTVKPGLVQYDIGDCLRSACNPLGEETPEWEAVTFDPAIARAVLEGYLAEARGFFAPADFDFVPEAARLIAFELGLRFFTDHMTGDVYFKVARRGQNLARALVQFKLAQRIDDAAEELRAIVEALR